jgi:predicted nuclease of predicted toxin-antitoxin system
MRLLLETHVHGALAAQLQRHGVDAIAVQDWQAGRYRNAPDEIVLVAAAAEGRVIVTFDLKTFSELLKVWAETGQRHAGVILVLRREGAAQDIGRLLRALLSLHVRAGDQAWTDRAVYLLPAEE